MQPTLNFLIELAKSAGEIVRRGYGQRHVIQYKSEIDLVTEVDHQSEAHLVAAIRRAYPEHSLITEEAGSLAGQACCMWYIDPLDGTVNYSHGLPFFCVSVAYAEDGQMRLGVVYDPMRDECFSAERGQGAWLNGELMHVSHTPDLAHSLLVTGFPYDMWESEANNLDNFIRFSRRSQAVRRLGSAALDLCYVAAGRLDGYWEIKIKPWDIAAGGLIVAEAGGVVTKLNGSPDYMAPPYDILATNPFVHAEMLKGLQEPPAWMGFSG